MDGSVHPFFSPELFSRAIFQEERKESFMAKEKKATSIDMTEGSSYRLIISFTLPLLLGNVFQQLYNMVDSIVVGNVIGDQALAAVGTGFPIIFMLSSLFMGVGTGATIMISQFYGARDLEKVNQTVNTIYTALIIGIIPLSLVGVFFSEPLLRMMHVPDDGTLQMAKTYMVIIFIGIIGNLGFNINAGILQGLGDSRTSLLFLMIATVINIVLDLVLTIPIKMGVAGVALATIIAQIASWLFGVFYINKRYDFIDIKPQKFYFEKRLFWQAMKLGIPSGIQQALFSIGIMFMQSLVNSYGSNFMAGFNGANKIDTFAFLPVQSLSNALTTYTGQNIGAGNQHRVKEGLKASMVLSVGCCIVVGVLLYPTSGFMMRMFSQNPEVIDAGVAYLHGVLPFYFLLAAGFMFNSVLRGAGEMVIPMISSFIGLWLARLPAAYLFAHFFDKESIYYSYAVGWVLGLLISGLYYAGGKWKNKSIVAKLKSEESR